MRTLWSRQILPPLFGLQGSTDINPIVTQRSEVRGIGWVCGSGSYAEPRVSTLRLAVRGSQGVRVEPVTVKALAFYSHTLYNTLHD